MRPSVTAFQISSFGGLSSVHGTVNRGESHRTIDEGSSYLWRRLSNLCWREPSKRRVGMGKDARFRRVLRTHLLAVRIPLAAQLWFGHYKDLLHRVALKTHKIRSGALTVQTLIFISLAAQYI